MVKSYGDQNTVGLRYFLTNGALRSSTKRFFNVFLCKTLRYIKFWMIWPRILIRKRRVLHAAYDLNLRFFSFACK